jgi:hypothetical protein
MHAHLAGGCARCGCERFEPRPCRFRKGKCSAEIRMARRIESERSFKPLSEEEIERLQIEHDAERGIDPAQCGVYFVQCEGFVKIGKTVNLRQRLMTHQMSTPFELTLLGFVQCPSYRLDETEGQFHRRFLDLHHRGEWFRLEEPISRFIEEIRPENAKASLASIG